MSPTRRDVLRACTGAAVAGAAGSTAGCLDFIGGEDADGYAAFLALWDFAEAVGGTELTFENPVETGEMGHGWDPDGDIVPSIVGTDLFIYPSTPEFQWALNAAETLERDHPDEVTLVDVFEGLGPYLLPFDGGGETPEPDKSREVSPEELAFAGFETWDGRNGTQTGAWHGEHWDGGLPSVAVDDEVPVAVVLRHVDDEGVVVPLGEGKVVRVDARIADGADTDVLDIESRGNRILLRGHDTGETGVVVEFYDGDELVYDTSDEPARVEVVETYGDSDAVGSVDPHAWVDPVIAERMVGTIADALVAHDPDNAETYRTNADTYRERIGAVDEAFEQLVAEASLDRAVFVGHDAFQYLQHRYGFELVTPTGVSPDESAAFEDISDLVAVIEEEGIDTVLYDPFESARPGEDRPALLEAIFENSDVDEAAPLTSVQGLTAEWADREMGWVEQMEAVNVDSLDRALNPE